MKIAIIVGTRPEIIKLSSTINLLRKHSEVTLIHTGQNYDPTLSSIFFSDLDIKEPDLYLEIENSSVGTFTGEVINRSYSVLKEINPDALLLLGDTNSCLSAYSAKRLKIPIFHIEAGNRCFDLNVPEEINRKIIDHLSDVNFTYTKLAKDYLVSEGLNPKYTIVVGSPMREVINLNRTKILNSTILDELGLVKGNYFLVSVHREENVDSKQNLEVFVKEIIRLEAKFKIPVVISMHPRTLNRIENFGIRLNFNDNIKVCKPFGFIDYCNLQKNAKIVLSDSGTITEESSIFKFRAISMRPVHERPEGEEVGAVVSSVFGNKNFQTALELVLSEDPKVLDEIFDYRTHNFASIILKNILSLTDVINTRVWRK